MRQPNNHLQLSPNRSRESLASLSMAVVTDGMRLLKTEDAPLKIVTAAKDSNKW